jgi:hypothetical protein
MAEQRTFPFRFCKGLNTVQMPRWLAYNPGTGEYEAAELVNVVVDDTGGILRRDGYSLALGGSWHSLWADGDDVLAVAGADLVRVRTDNSTETLVTGLTAGARVSFTRVGGWVFWANGFEHGVLENGAPGAWGGRTWPYADDVREMISPPVGHLVEYFSGRVFIAVDDFVCGTEPGGFYHFVDNVSGWLIPFGGRVGMLRAVEGGLYVGTDRGIWFLKALDAGNFSYQEVSGSPVCPGTDVPVDPTLTPRVGGMSVSGRGVLWTGRDGIFFGGAGGQIANVTNGRVTFPAGGRGTACIYNGRYVAVMEE